MTLTRNNLQQFRQNIPEEALPKTFRDAICVCRYLGIGFLWIDSLCIIQDSGEDWGRESSAMARVYGDAYLNIAATSAKDGTVGCFFDRSRDWRCQHQLDSGDQETLYDIFHGKMLNPAQTHWAIELGLCKSDTSHGAHFISQKTKSFGNAITTLRLNFFLRVIRHAFVVRTCHLL
jgi:hypothetical protein